MKHCNVQCRWQRADSHVSQAPFDTKFSILITHHRDTAIISLLFLKLLAALLFPLSFFLLPTLGHLLCPVRGDQAAVPGGASLSAEAQCYAWGSTQPVTPTTAKSGRSLVCLLTAWNWFWLLTSLGAGWGQLLSPISPPPPTPPHTHSSIPTHNLIGVILFSFTYFFPLEGW